MSPTRPRRRTPSPLRCAIFAALAALLLTALPAAAGAPATDARPQVRFTTNLGSFEVALFPDKAPQTVANFLRLVDDGFYEGLIFHRVVAGFVIQTGGYDADMNYREPPGTVANESANGLLNRKGTLAMARLADPDSADAQFFVNVNDNTHLDAAPGRPGYTVFGEVTAGMDVVTDIELADASLQANMAGVPDTPIVIEKVERL